MQRFNLWVLALVVGALGVFVAASLVAACGENQSAPGAAAPTSTSSGASERPPATPDPPAPAGGGW
jgi:hypothetical protein